MSDADARLWHPWLRINRVLRVMLDTRWRAEAWPQVQRRQFKRALALRSEIQRAGLGLLTPYRGLMCWADAGAVGRALRAQEPVAFRTVVTAGTSALRVQMPATAPPWLRSQ
jgi:hypothetical protein